MFARPFPRAFLPAAACAGALLCLSAFDAPGVSQDGKLPDPPADPRDGVPDLPKVDETTKGAREGQDLYPRRLPAGYGAVGLSREQKEKVYAVQAKYDGRIQELLDEIAAIKNKQDAEIAAVLTPGQREFLKNWRAEREAEAAAEAEKAGAKNGAKDGADGNEEPAEKS